MKASEKTIALASRMDAKISERFGRTTTPMRDAIESLQNHGSVEIGWRESCGKTDPTMHEKRAWVSVLKALRADGNEIVEERQKHGNAYATSKGGFWASIIYRCAP